MARAEKAIAINPKNADALTLRANALAALRTSTGRSRRSGRRLLLIRRPNRQRTWASCSTKGLEEAEAAFRQAVATDPKSIDPDCAREVPVRHEQGG